jgi:LacI family transcriptional regulator, galactose operon repressor
MTVADSSPGTPTMRDVADYAKVSPMTVSRTLRDDPSVAPETRSRVLEAVAALGYRRNEAARSLRLGRSTGLLGVVITNLANPFYAQLALGIESAADERGMRVVFANSGEDPERERQLVQDFAGRRLDGVIVAPTANQHDHLDPAALSGMPVVLAASPPHRINVDAVLLDDFGGTYEATRTLIARGHAKVGFLGLPAAKWTGSERFRGYCAALEEAGLPIEERFIRRDQPDVAAAVAAAGAILDQPDPPTALFAANNRNTIGAYRAIRARGGDTALAGFDDFDFADLLDLPLIVVSYDARKLGRVAAELLCEHIDEPKPTGTALGRRIIVPTTIIDYRNASSSRQISHRSTRPNPARRRRS